MMPILICTVLVAQRGSSQPQVNVNGQVLAARAILRKDRIQVPMRAIFEALGAHVQWIPENRKVVAKKGRKTITMVMGEKFAYDPNPVVLDYPPTISNGHIMVPLRFVSESLGARVKWDSLRHTARVNTR
ncbi:hypothetical protein BH11ARM1_BH11ARM1_02950 [soil metagenome]